MKPERQVEEQEAVWQEYGHGPLCYLFMQISFIFRTYSSSVSQSCIHDFHLLMDYCYACPTLWLGGWMAQDKIRWIMTKQTFNMY